LRFDTLPGVLPDDSVWRILRGDRADGGAKFVGRNAELEKLHARLARARAGSGCVVALVGEAGIGKTRAALAFAERARDEGAVVATGTCAEGEWDAPLRPWSEALGGIVQRLGEKNAARVVGPARGTIAWFVPELSASAGAPALDARDERSRMHHAVCQLLARASEEAPLVLVLDDLQWADADSLALLQAVARQASNAPWVIVIAYREGEADVARAALGEVQGALKDGDFERIPLRGLSLDEVAAQARACAGAPLSEWFVRTLFDETVGNPFYVSEVLRLLADEGTMGKASSGDEVAMRTLGIPRGVREVVARRLAKMSEPAARVLRVASAMASPCEGPLLGALAELEGGALAEAIQAAVATGLLRACDGTTGRTATAATGPVPEAYEIAHSIARRVIHDGLQPDLRARLHRRIAEALEASYLRRPGFEARIAGEYYASSAIPGAELGVPHAVEAAREAMAACAHERAVVFLRLARELARSAPVHVRAEAACELALAEARASRTDDALATVDDAVEAMAATEAAPEEIAAFVGEVARELKSGGAPQVRWGVLVERALALIGSSRSLTWARLALMEEQYEPLAYGAVNLSRALPRDPEAMKRARQEGDEDDYASTLDDAPRTRAESEQLVRLAGEWARPTAKLRALSVAVRELVYRHAAFADARRHAETMLRTATRAGSIPGKAEALIYLATCDASLGAVERSLESRARAQLLVPTSSASQMTMHVTRLGLDAMLAYYGGGEWRALAESAARATADPSARRSPAGHVAAGIAALGYAQAGYAREARSLLGHLATIFERCDASVHHYGVALGCATTAVWHLGARDLAAKYLALERGAPTHAGIAPYASRELNLGRMAVLLEEWGDAREHLARADVLLLRRGLRPLHAIALHDEASALLRSGGDAARVRTRLTAALRAFRVLGMEPWIVHTHQLLSLPRPAYPDGLTSREVEILSMVVEGRGAYGIASTLGVAVTAARKETSRAYAKIGARGRAAAEAYATDHGLLVQLA
jgi:DNA-binding NarL/FixJ family response regulator